MTVLAASPWKTNAEIILDLAELGYLKTTDLILDPTFGKGNWWTQWRSVDLIANNRQWDFRACPWPDEMFDVVAYDPPYVAKGGRETSGIRDMDDAYGQYDCPATPALLQELINDGLTEMWRVAKTGGVVLVKCMNYISSGKLWLGAYYTLEHALGLGFRVEEVLTHVGDPGPQPPDRRQVHARNNASTMYVLRKVKVKVDRGFATAPFDDFDDTALFGDPEDLASPGSQGTDGDTGT